MHKCMELEESLKENNDAKILSRKYKEEIEELFMASKVSIRPSKLYMNESPFHCRFKSSISTFISNISGDSSPPAID